MEEKFVTAAGIPLYAYRNPALHGFCLSLYVRAGAMYEDADRSGETHFVEHMLFRNINRRMDGGLYPLLDRCGLSFNAETYKEFVQFYLVGSSAHFADAVTVFSHLFDEMDLPRSEIDPERQRIKSEIRESNEETSLEFFSDGIVWENTTLARSILGRHKTLDAIGRTALKDAARRVFSSNNLFFYVTGSVTDAQIADFCSALSAPLENTAPFRDNTAPVPAHFQNRPREIFVKSSEETSLRFSFDFDATSCSHAEMMLLYDILFYGECGKIYRELSDRTGLIYSFDPSLERYGNIGVLHLRYEVRPANLVRSVELVCQILCDLKRGLTDELDYVRPLYLDNGPMLLDHAEDLNWNRAYEVHILNCPYVSHEDRAKAFASVSPQRISQLAREIFRPENLTLAIKGNKKWKTEKKLLDLVEKLG